MPPTISASIRSALVRFARLCWRDLLHTLRRIFRQKRHSHVLARLIRWGGSAHRKRWRNWRHFWRQTKQDSAPEAITWWTGECLPVWVSNDPFVCASWMKRSLGGSDQAFLRGVFKAGFCGLCMLDLVGPGSRLTPRLKSLDQQSARIFHSPDCRATVSRYLPRSSRRLPMANGTSI